MKFSILLVSLLAAFTIQAPAVEVPHIISINYCTYCGAFIAKARKLIDTLPREFPDEKFEFKLTPLIGKNRIIVGNFKKFFKWQKLLQASLMSSSRKLEHQNQFNFGEFLSIACKYFHLKITLLILCAIF